MEIGDRTAVATAAQFKPADDGRLNERHLAATRLDQETASREGLRAWRAELASMIAFIDRTLADSESAEAAETESLAEATNSRAAIEQAVITTQTR